MIEIPAIDSGSYDRYGFHDAREDGGLAGLTAQSRARGPIRSFLVFPIPQFPGTLTNAALVSDVYSISPQGGESIDFRSVETPVSTLRTGGFGLTGIHSDLGDGVFYGSATFASGFFYDAFRQLNPSAVTAINAARGQDFAMGGAIANLNSEVIYNEYIVLPFSPSDRARLRLEISAPARPVIYTQPQVHHLFPDYTIVDVAACGALPMSYYWFVNGTNSASSYSDTTNSALQVSPLPPASTPVFVVVSNSFGTATSAVAQVQRIAANVFWPVTNVVTRVGLTFQVFPVVQMLAGGAPTLVWRKNGILFDNLSSYLSFNSAQLSNTGDYTLTVSNSFGIVASAVFRLTVVETPPVFWEEPQDRSVALGDNVFWSAFAQAGPPSIYQWFHNSTPLPDQNGSTLGVFDVRQGDAGAYYVVASNRVGVVTSAVANLTVVLDPPAFTQQPQSRVGYPGGQATFSVSVSGTPFPQRQWYFNGAPIVGANSSQYTISNVTSNHAGAYFCVASNLSGVVTSEVAVLTVSYLPPVVAGPSDLLLLAGGTAVFAVTISNPPVQVQWQFNGTNIPGTFFGDPSNHYLFLNNVDTQDSGLYWAIVSNAFGVTTSRVATLTVETALPMFASQPTNQSVLEGATVDISVLASGGPPPQLFLFRDGIPTGALPEFQRFRLLDVRISDSGEYTVVASNRIGTVASQPFRIDVQRAGPLDRWTFRNPLPQGVDLFAITHGQNKFVAVGRNGTIINSLDGTNWNLRNFRTSSELQAAAYGDGRFVALGEDGIALTSTNGDDWAGSYITGVSEFDAVIHADGKFVAVGPLNPFAGRAGIFTSSNGVDWASVSDATPSVYSLRGIAHGNGAYVAVDSANSFRSTDLVTWTVGPTNIAPFDIESLRFVEDRFMVVGNGGEIVTSPDGITWTPQISGTPTRLEDSAHGNGTYVAVGGRGQVHRSSDAIAWSPASSPTEDRLEAVTFANNLFVAVGERGMIITSTDAQTWANQLRVTSRDLDGMAAGQGMLMTVGKNDTILTSPDGRHWTRRPVPVTDTNFPADWHGVGFGDGKWVVVGDTTNILTSTNAIDWEVRSHPAPQRYLKHVTHGGGLWVAVGLGGMIVTSSNAVEWTQQFTPFPYDLNEVVYGDGLFVVVGDAPSRNGTILTSTNGTLWIDRTFNSGKNIRAITFANGLFVVAMNDGVIIYGTNPNALAWNYALTGVAGDGHNLRGLTYSSGLWVCVGNDGRILTSTNAQVWKQRISPTEENLHAVRYLNGTFVAAGNAGTILQSGPLVPQLAATREAGQIRLTLASPFEGIYKLQHTENFTWGNLADLTNEVGTVDYTVPIPPGNAVRFYRVIAP